MKRVGRFLLFLFSLTLFIMPLCVCVCVVRVYADVPTDTYLQLEYGCNVVYVGYDNIVAQNHIYNVTVNTNDVRFVMLKPSNSISHSSYLVSEQPFSLAYTSVNNASSIPSSCTVMSLSQSATLQEGYYVFNLGSFNHYYTQTDGNVQIVEDNGTVSNAIYYTFGGGAVGPEDVTTWGLVDLIGYQTNVAGSGNAAINNVDVISWNDTFDTLSNDITEGNVRIRYVPGHYKAVDKPNLLQQLYTDFILDTVIDDAEGLYPVTDGSASFRWGQVIQDLSIPFYSIYNLSNSAEGWIKRGWIYQVRLEIDDYIGEWQTVYASTSSGVENDMEIVSTTTITQNTINAIQQVNTINDTTNIWIIYETPVDPSPEYQPPEDDDEKPWWVYLLEMINNSIGVTNEYISEGTDESVQVVNNINNDNDTLNQTVNEYDDIEDDLITDFNDNTNNIDLDDTLIGNNGFLNAARWISQQFTTITTDNPFGAILKFSLVLGFVLIFLGRFR